MDGAPYHTYIVVWHMLDAATEIKNARNPVCAAQRFRCCRPGSKLYQSRQAAGPFQRDAEPGRARTGRAVGRAAVEPDNAQRVVDRGRRAVAQPVEAAARRL